MGRTEKQKATTKTQDTTLGVSSCLCVLVVFGSRLRGDELAGRNKHLEVFGMAARILDCVVRGDFEERARRFGAAEVREAIASLAGAWIELAAHDDGRQFFGVPALGYYLNRSFVADLSGRNRNDCPSPFCPPASHPSGSQGAPRRRYPAGAERA